MSTAFDELYDAFMALQRENTFDAHQWRMFIFLCCESVISLISLPFKHDVLECARECARYGTYSHAAESLHRDLLQIEDVNWAKVMSLRDSQKSEWPISFAVDQAWKEYYGTLSLRNTVAKDMRLVELPTAQAELFGWSAYQQEPDAIQLQEDNDDVFKLRDRLIADAREHEEKRQLAIFLEGKWNKKTGGT